MVCVWIAIKINLYIMTDLSFTILLGLPYQKPKRLVTSYGSAWLYQPDTNLMSILQETVKHYNHFENKRDDKTHRPIYLFLSGAGTGKSRNATEFHDTLIKCLRDTKDSELCK